MSSDASFERARLWKGPISMGDGAHLIIRPLRADDAERDRRFIDSLSDDSRHLRFFRRFSSVPAELLTRMMDIDYDKSMALVATIDGESGEQFIGVASYGATECEDVAEFAVAVLDVWQKRGIATVLVSALMNFALDHGFKTFTGDVLPENEGMLKLARGLRFDVSYDADVDLMHISRALRA
jgi:acetyltransferase